MASPEHEILKRKLLYEVGRGELEVLNFHEVLQWAETRDENFAIMLGEFESVCDDLNLLVERPDTSPTLYKNVLRLREILGDPPLSIADAIYACEHQHEAGDDGFVRRVARETFLTINEKMRSGEWSFVTRPPTFLPRSRIAARMLVEGWGVFVEKFHGDEESRDVAQTAVLAWHEALFTKHRNTDLFGQLGGWMVEQKDRFSPALQIRLEEIEQRR